jgi:glycosyltransferase involved in cell wall biosynthesis
MSEQKKKLLMDLWPVAHGHGGIPHECRLIFDMFTEINSVDMTGYLNWPQSKMLRADIMSPKRPVDERIFLQSQFVFRTTAPRKGKVTDLLEQEGIEPKFMRYVRIFNRLRRTYQGFGMKLMPFDSDLFADFVWSEVFATSLDADRRSKLVNRPYRFSNTSRSVAHVLAMNTGFHQAIDTRGFDFYFTFANYAWRLPRSTMPVLRYYDSIPLTHPHFFQDMVPVQAHYKTTKYNAEDGRSVFVCDSNPVRAELVRLFPQLEERSLTIPCFVYTGRSTEPSSLTVAEIVNLRISLRAGRYGLETNEDDESADAKKQEHKFEQRIGSKIDQLLTDETDTKKAQKPKEEAPKSEDDEADDRDAAIKRAVKKTPKRSIVPPVTRYLIAVSTLEPRKNYARLAQAWRVVKARLPKDETRLVVVANLGWKVTEAVQAMAPLIARGHIVHLEKCETRELHRLYRDSIGVVAPSVVEGYDYSGVEGMYHGCPVIASDIPVHRSIYESVPIYFDPYDVEDLAEKLERLVVMPENERRELGHRGQQFVQRYHRDAMKHEWVRFTDELIAGKWHKKDS